MTQDTIGVIQDYYKALNEGDRMKLLQLLTEDVVHDLNQGKREVGKEAFKKFLEHMSRCYRERLTNLVIFSNIMGDRAAAECMAEGVYLLTDHEQPPAKGQRYRVAKGVFFEMRGDQIARITTYYNLAEWLNQIK